MDQIIYNSLFTLPSYYDIWPTINATREAFGFNDPLSDSQLIEENRWVVQQYRKFVFTLEEEVMKAYRSGGYEEVSEYLINKAEKLDDDFKDRKSAMYQALRNSWLTGAIQIVSLEIDNKIVGGDE